MPQPENLMFYHIKLVDCQAHLSEISDIEPETHQPQRVGYYMKGQKNEFLYGQKIKVVIYCD